MQVSNYRTPTTSDSGIKFPRLECWNAVTKVATVAADVNKKRVLCRISLEVLMEKFGASDDEPMLMVYEHRQAIQEAARKLIEGNVYEDDYSVVIRASDL